MPRRKPLKRQILAFSPFDEPEAAHRGRMLELIEAAGDPFSRSHFAPGHFTASAFVLSPDRSSLLLIFHGRFHRWLQPGGHVDPTDPDLASAARREVLEETGVLVKSPPDPEPRTPVPLLLDLDIHPIPANPKRGEPAHEHFDVRFLLHAEGPAFRAGSDAKDARWVALDEVTEELTDASVMRAVKKLRALPDGPLP